MIPLDRPVVGDDLEQLRKDRGMSVADAVWVFGLSAPKWSQIVAKGKSEPVPATIALVVRLLDANPTLSLIPKMPDVAEFFDYLQTIDERVSLKSFAVMSGKEASGGYRWLTLGGRQVPSRERLFLSLRNLLEAVPEKERKTRLQEYLNLVTAEAAARGAAEVFKTGSWTEGKPARATKKVAKD